MTYIIIIVPGKYIKINVEINIINYLYIASFIDPVA